MEIRRGSIGTGDAGSRDGRGAARWVRTASRRFPQVPEPQVPEPMKPPRFTPVCVVSAGATVLVPGVVEDVPSSV